MWIINWQCERRQKYKVRKASQTSASLAAMWSRPFFVHSYMISDRIRHLFDIYNSMIRASFNCAVQTLNWIIIRTQKTFGLLTIFRHRQSLSVFERPQTINNDQWVNLN